MSSGPKYNEGAAQRSQEAAAQAQAKYGTYGVSSPLGSLNLTQNADGTYSRNYTMNNADTQREVLISQALSGLSTDPTQAQNAYYNQATRLITPQFESQEKKLEETLVNRGLTPGSVQYNEQMKNLRDTQQGTLSDIANQSVFQGQNLLGSQISNIGALAGQRDILNLPSLSGTTGANFSSTYDNAYQGKLLNAQGANAVWSGIGGLAGTLGGAAIGALSDKRLKENLIKIGTLESGLNLYIGNYNDKALEIDPSLTKKPQLFLIAQEVKEVYPQAVKEKDGYLMLDLNEVAKYGYKK